MNKLEKLHSFNWDMDELTNTFGITIDDIVDCSNDFVFAMIDNTLHRIDDKGYCIRATALRQRLQNWQHLCIFGRLSSTDIDIDGHEIYHDGKTIIVKRAINEIDLKYIDKKTGKVLLIQGEDGFPIYKSEWANLVPTEPYQIA